MKLSCLLLSLIGGLPLSAATVFVDISPEEENQTTFERLIDLNGDGSDDLRFTQGISNFGAKLFALNGAELLVDNIGVGNVSVWLGEGAFAEIGLHSRMMPPPDNPWLAPYTGYRWLASGNPAWLSFSYSEGNGGNFHLRDGSFGFSFLEAGQRHYGMMFLSGEIFSVDQLHYYYESEPNTAFVYPIPVPEPSSCLLSILSVSALCRRKRL